MVCWRRLVCAMGCLLRGYINRHWGATCGGALLDRRLRPVAMRHWARDHASQAAHLQPSRACVNRTAKWHFRRGQNCYNKQCRGAGPAARLSSERRPQGHLRRLWSVCTPCAGAVGWAQAGQQLSGRPPKAEGQRGRRRRRRRVLLESSRRLLPAQGALRGRGRVGARRQTCDLCHAAAGPQTAGADAPAAYAQAWCGGRHAGG